MIATIYLDTNILITAFEDDTGRQAMVWPILHAIERGEFAAVTSQITLAELLTRPFALGITDLIAAYQDLFAREGLFRAVPISLEVLTEAARIRAGARAIKLPDAIHLATAKVTSCRTILTDDRRLDGMPGCEVIAPGPDSLHHLRSSAD